MNQRHHHKIDYGQRVTEWCNPPIAPPTRGGMPPWQGMLSLYAPTWNYYDRHLFNPSIYLN